VMSYFHKEREQELFDKLNITDDASAGRKV